MLLMDFFSECATPRLLWYTKPANNWNEVLPVGNGRWGDERFVCQGGITMNLKWANGTLQSVELYSRQKQKVMVRYREKCKMAYLDKGMNHFDLSFF